MKNQYEIDYQQGYDKANDEWLERMNKIRAEIKELDDKLCRQFLIEDADKEVHHAYRECLDIIDKYKAESEST